MTWYLLRRGVLLCVVVLLVMTFLALLIHLVPGDPARAILGQHASEEMLATVRKEMRLDDPFYIQVRDFIWNAVHGDLGRDFQNQIPVTDYVGSALPHTIILAVTALALALLVGLPLGVYSATHPNSWLDRFTGVLSISVIAIPSYVAGLVLLLIFSIWLKAIPAVGAGSFSDPLDYGKHLILPAVALALAWAGYLARVIRTNMLEVLNSDYVRAAHAFGVETRTVHYRLALKNAMIPVVALLGVGLGTLMGGAIFVERIFNRPGLGTTIYTAILEKNYTIVRGGVLVVALLFVLANLLADLCYRLLDPRIQYSERAQ
jgi:peptide/nickel transport system permease protein